jgi:hypothetical protein
MFETVLYYFLLVFNYIGPFLVKRKTSHGFNEMSGKAKL